MARTKRTVKVLATIWRVSDELWNQFIHPVLLKRDPPSRVGRPRIDARAATNGVIYQRRTGYQWEAIPAEFGHYKSIHRTFQRWLALGVLEEIWALLVDHCDELDGVRWAWQSGDATMVKAVFGGTTRGRTPRIVGKTAANAA